MKSKNALYDKLNKVECEGAGDNDGFYEFDTTDCHLLDGNSKRNDPISSVEAGEEVVKSGTAKGHYRRILVAMGRLPQTNMEIARRAYLSQAQVARRMLELERRGLIERGPFITCPILKRKAGTWATTVGGNNGQQ